MQAVAPKRSRRVKGRMAFFTDILSHLRVGGPPYLLMDDSAAVRSAIYQAAYRLGVQIAIRGSDDGTKVWRLT